MDNGRRRFSTNSKVALTLLLYWRPSNRHGKLCPAKRDAEHLHLKINSRADERHTMVLFLGQGFASLGVNQDPFSIVAETFLDQGPPLSRLDALRRT